MPHHVCLVTAKNAMACTHERLLGDPLNRYSHSCLHYILWIHCVHNQCCTHVYILFITTYKVHMYVLLCFGVPQHATVE